jgi:hypothetical protein
MCISILVNAMFALTVSLVKEVKIRCPKNVRRVDYRRLTMDLAHTFHNTELFQVPYMYRTKYVADSFYGLLAANL